MIKMSAEVNGLGWVGLNDLKVTKIQTKLECIHQQIKYFLTVA